MECLEADYWSYVPFNPPVIQLYPVVEVCAVADLDTVGKFLGWPPKPACCFTNSGGLMVDLTTISDNARRYAMACQSLGH